MAIATVPMTMTIRPVMGDNRTRIQATIDLVSALPLDTNGFRRAMPLTAGLYGVNGSLVVRTSEVVLRR